MKSYIYASLSLPLWLQEDYHKDLVNPPRVIHSPLCVVAIQRNQVISWWAPLHMHKNGKQIEKCKMLLIKQEISHSANKHLFLNDKHNTRTLLGLLQWMRLKPTSSLLQLVLFPSYSDWKVAKTHIILEFWYIKTRNLHVWIFAFIFKCVFVCVCIASLFGKLKKKKLFSSLMLTYFF